MEGSTSAKSNEQDEAARAAQSPSMKKELEGADDEDDEDDSEEDQGEGQAKDNEKGGGSEQEDKKIDESSSGGAPQEHDKPEGNSAQPPSQQQQSYPPPATPGATSGAIPIQPYGYPPAYPYYPPMPGYGSNLASPQGADPFQMMATSSLYGYTDVSTLVDPTPDTRRNRGGVTEPFPEKLHRMLESAERERTTDVVSFFSHGRAFAIHKPRRFVQEVMPRFFRQTRLTSFQRQLNLYGFRRISQGPDNGGYYHELFLKGRPGLSVNMKRTKVKGKAKVRRDPDAEPNFYSYPPLPAQSATTAAPSHPTTFALMPAGPPPAPSPYPAYAYPPPPYGYPQMATAPPYTAAQQGLAPTAYMYPPYYGYPYYPGYPQPPHPGLMAGPTATTTPLSSPSKAREPKTPVASIPAQGSDTPASIEAVDV